MSNRIFTAACALALLSGTSAFAEDHHGGGPGGAPHPAGAPHGGGGATHAPPAGGGFHGGGAPATHFTAPPATGGFHGGGGAHVGGGAPATHTYADHAGGGGHGAHVAIAAGVAGVAVGAAVAHGGYHGGGGDHHYSEQAYPREVNPGRQYHFQGEWRQPHGYYYRHWGYGDRLPRGWFARNFWITNFWAYGLAPAPYGYAWVREGPDALLVNVYTGMVVEVEYGVFY